MARWNAATIDETYKQKVRELRLEGFSKKRIARETHSGEAKVVACLDDMGLGTHLKKKLDLDLTKHLYVDELLSCSEIAKTFGCSVQTIANRLRQMGCMRTMSETLKLAAQHIPKEKLSQRASKGGRLITPHGYIRLLMPGHCLADHSGYVLEHRLVWEESHNQPLPKDWVVHHINGIKADNRPDNLIAYPKGKHAEVIPIMAEKIRRLEIENRQLRRALEDSQMIMYVGEN